MADAGYESLENYLYLESNNQLCFIKPTNYDQKKTFWEKRAQATERITSQRGIHLRLCRSVQVEGAFDLKKLWMKREQGRLQTRESKKMTA